MTRKWDSTESDPNFFRVCINEWDSGELFSIGLSKSTP